MRSTHVRPQVALVPWVDRREEVLALEVTTDQKPFISDQSVAEFLADDDDHPTFNSYAVCVGSDVVGLVCFGYEIEHELWRRWLVLLVIDTAQQGKGLGRAAMDATIARIRRDNPSCRTIGLSCKPENLVAWRLYEDLGFEAADPNPRGGIDMWLALESESSAAPQD